MNDKPEKPKAAKPKADSKPKTDSKPKAENKKSADAAGAAQEGAAAASAGTPRLLAEYRERIVPQLTKEFGYTNPFAVPRLTKIVINMGVGEATADQKKLDSAVAELAAISGQKPVKTKAKKAIAGFKIRAGLPIGAKVTLRRARMYEFLDRLVNIALPRVRDFRGIGGRNFDGRGNFAMGLKEQIVFPEIVYDKVDAVRGMDIIIVTTAKTDNEAKALLKAFNMPFSAT